MRVLAGHGVEDLDLEEYEECYPGTRDCARPVPNRKSGGSGIAVSSSARRLGWGLADQGMSSLSNAALSFYMAHQLGATQFGAFSIAYVTYSFALNASRGLATEPLLVRFSGAELPAWRKAVSRSNTTVQSGI